MQTKFIIFAYPRTGSYALTSLLDSADDIVCHGEIFKKGQIELRPWHRSRLSDISVERRDQEPLEYIERLSKLNPKKIFGFKIFQEHLTRINQQDYLLQSEDWKKIALIRDPIEVYASLLRAYETNIWT